MKNPIAKEQNPKIVIKAGKDLSKKKEEFNSGYVDAGIMTDLIGMNNAVYIISNACACCWDKPVPSTYSERTEYIAKRVKTGHTSILEHSNFVLYLRVSPIYMEDLYKFATWTNYLRIASKYNTEDEKWHVIIGGSFRGFADIFKEADDLNNIILKQVKGMIQLYIGSYAFEDIINDGLLRKEDFTDADPDMEAPYWIGKDTMMPVDSKVDIYGIDDINKLYANINAISKSGAKLFTTFDLIKFCTITVLFKNMSRTATHQLVRHRNAITQESQRYVDYSQACFSSPADFKNTLDKNHKYDIKFAGTSHKMTLAEIGDAECAIYNQLIDKTKTGNYYLVKEDARAFLPGNVQCRKIFMTYTFKNLFKFLDLREDKAAQAEIRSFAIALGNWIRMNTVFSSSNIINTYTKPRLCIEEPYSVELEEGVGDVQEQTFDVDAIVSSTIGPEGGKK